jgi:hypothetical protein
MVFSSVSVYALITAAVVASVSSARVIKLVSHQEAVHVRAYRSMYMLTNSVLV